MGNIARTLSAAQTLALLALAAVVGYVAWRAYRYLESMGDGSVTLGAGIALKEKTPFGLPAKGIDAGISAATGREETLGGMLAEWFNPATRAANEMLDKSPLPHVQRQEPDHVEPYVWNPVDTELRRILH